MIPRVRTRIINTRHPLPSLLSHTKPSSPKLHLKRLKSSQATTDQHIQDSDPISTLLPIENPHYKNSPSEDVDAPNRRPPLQKPLSCQNLFLEECKNMAETCRYMDIKRVDEEFEKINELGDERYVDNF